MSTTAKERQKLKLWQRLLAISVVLVLVGSCLGYAVNTDFGKVQVKDMSFVTDSGVSLAGTLYIPDGTSAENPAPAVIVQHGGNCNHETMSAFSVLLHCFPVWDSRLCLQRA